MTCYLELPLGTDKGMEYFHAEDVLLVSSEVWQRTRRIWDERPNGSVYYIKVRSLWISDMSKVDMKEFFWVKLRSRHVRDFQ